MLRFLVNHSCGEAAPKLIDLMTVDRLRSSDWRTESDLPDGGTIMCVDSTHNVSHRRKHRHIAGTDRSFYVWQDKWLCFHTARISKHGNNRGSLDSFSLNGCLSQLRLMRIPPAS